MWTIIDDGSKDNSYEIIKKAEEKYDWIHSVQLFNTTRDRGKHLADVLKKGFHFCYNHCKNNGIKFDYLGSVDGDGILEPTYFENLLKHFNDNPILGIAGGEDYLVDNDQKIHMKSRYPSGGGVLYRRECFEECGGIPISYSNDSVLNVKALMKGWEVKRFSDSKIYRKRGYCSGEGLWNGYKKVGEGHYYLNFNISYMFAKGIKFSLKKPYYIGLAYIWGYLVNLLLRSEQINDDEIKYYFKYVRPQELKHHYFEGLKKKLKL